MLLLMVYFCWLFFVLSGRLFLSWIVYILRQSPGLLCNCFQNARKAQYLTPYTCLVSSYTTASPSVFISPASAMLDVNDTIVLECIATGSPQPDTSWSAPSLSTTLPNGVRVDGNRLEISHFDGSLAGDYRCTATNVHGSESAEVAISLDGKN